MAKVCQSTAPRVLTTKAREKMTMKAVPMTNTRGTTTRAFLVSSVRNKGDSQPKKVSATRKTTMKRTVKSEEIKNGVRLAVSNENILGMRRSVRVDSIIMENTTNMVAEVLIPLNDI